MALFVFIILRIYWLFFFFCICRYIFFSTNMGSSQLSLQIYFLPFLSLHFLRLSWIFVGKLDDVPCMVSKSLLNFPHSFLFFSLDYLYCSIFIFTDLFSCHLTSALNSYSEIFISIFTFNSRVFHFVLLYNLSLLTFYIC